MVEALLNLAALRHNARIARSLAPRSKLMAVIKANAYGHGMIPVARALTDSADGFAVARLDEAQTLRDNGIEGRLLMMSSLPDSEELLYCARHKIDIVIHDPLSVQMVAKTKLPAPINIWLKIDSGMHRLGVPPSSAAIVYRKLRALPWVREIVLMSHFASADEVSNPFTDKQLAVFEQSTAGLSGPVSLANSAAILTRAQTHREWIRPGIMLYGASPVDAESHHPPHPPLHPQPHPHPHPQLQVVMTLRSHLLAVRTIEVGESVGYNQTWTSPRRALIGTIAAGYGDGYPRQAPSGTPVLVNNRRVPLVGRVSMDMIMVDLTEQPGAQSGDEVVLWGEGLSVSEIARHANTIAYELLTRVSLRPRRTYRELNADQSSAK